MGRSPGLPSGLRQLRAIRVRRLQTSWPFSLSSWQSRHGPAGMRTATTIYPALCNLMTADDLARIRSLSSAGSKKNLNANDFAGLTNLRSLTLASSWGTTQIREFPAGLFDGLTNLRNLEMRNGLLGTLPARIFDDLTSLQTLNLPQQSADESSGWDFPQHQESPVVESGHETG